MTRTAPAPAPAARRRSLREPLVAATAASAAAPPGHTASSAARCGIVSGRCHPLASPPRQAALTRPPAARPVNPARIRSRDTWGALRRSWGNGGVPPRSRTRLTAMVCARSQPTGRVPAYPPSIAPGIRCGSRALCVHARAGHCAGACPGAGPFLQEATTAKSSGGVARATPGCGNGAVAPRTDYTGRALVHLTGGQPKAPVPTSRERASRRGRWVFSRGWGDSWQGQDLDRDLRSPPMHAPGKWRAGPW